MSFIASVNKNVIELDSSTVTFLETDFSFVKIRRG